MKKICVFLLVLYSVTTTYLLFNNDVFSRECINRSPEPVLSGDGVFSENLPQCIVDLETSNFYHDHWMCANFMAYEYRSKEQMTSMSAYEAEYRGFRACPFCDPAYKAYIKLK